MNIAVNESENGTPETSTREVSAAGVPVSLEYVYKGAF